VPEWSTPGSVEAVLRRDARPVGRLDPQSIEGRTLDHVLRARVDIPDRVELRDSARGLLVRGQGEEEVDDPPRSGADRDHGEPGVSFVRGGERRRNRARALDIQLLLPR